MKNQLKVQQYLEHHTFGDLEKDHAVEVSFSKSGHKFSLNYSQINAKDNDELAQECRGLILACHDGRSLNGQAIIKNGKLDYSHLSPQSTVVLNYGFKRFFNYGQEAAAKIDWQDSKLSVQSKLDGSCIFVYNDPFTNQFCAATRSVSEADQLMDNGLFTFRTLFEKALLETTNLTFSQFTQHLNPNYTYCFELTSPLNRIVCQYDDYRITLLAVRDLTSLQELDPNTISFPFNFPRVKTFSFSSTAEMVEWVNQQDPLQHEGVVVKGGQLVDGSSFPRVKVKNPAYVLYNKLHDSLGNSPRNCLELILLEKDDDVIPMMPVPIADNLRRIKIGLAKIIHDHDQTYQSILSEAPDSKKAFAGMVMRETNTPPNKLWSAPFFQMFDHKADNMKDFLLKNKDQTGTWSNSFLDKLLDLM